MPGAAPVAAVGVEFHGGAGGGDLVFGCCQCRAFGGVFALAADRAFGGVVHREPSGNSHHGLMQATRAIPGASHSKMPLMPTTIDSVACKKVVPVAEILTVLSWCDLFFQRVTDHD